MTKRDTWSLNVRPRMAWRDVKSDSQTFYYQRMIVKNGFDPREPWNLTHRIRLDVQDSQEANAIYSELSRHGVMAALIFRAGLINDVEKLDSTKHKEWWLYLESEADRTAAMLLI